MAMLGLVASRAAHDLNNQLMVAMANLELGFDVPEARENAMEQAMASIHRAADLTERMLAFAGKDGEGGVAFDFAAALRSDDALLRMVVPGRIEFKLEVPSEPIGVRAHPARLQQVLLNLVLNAVEAIGEREGRIRVGLRAEGADRVCLEVQDDGCGMDGPSKERLFEPFRTTKSTGRGLGMSAVLEILRSLGGEIKVQSRHDEGTLFRICLPRAEGPLAPIPSKLGRKPLSRTRTGGKILVVEDDPFVRQIVASHLGRAGHTPFTAPNADAALELMETVGNFWLALVDVSLGADDGICLMRAIREGSPRTLVALMSGYSRDQAIEYAMEQPDGFLTKPFQSAELEAELNRLSARFRAAAEASPPPEAPPPGIVPDSGAASASP